MTGNHTSTEFPDPEPGESEARRQKTSLAGRSVLPNRLRAYSMDLGRADARQDLATGERVPCPYEANDPSITRRRLRAAWWDGFHEVNPIPDLNNWV
jgi:hypothetical protein